MAESRNIALVEDESNILLLRYSDLEFVDDVTDYKCGRCERVIIKHYISNCGHHFCLNCKKILEDGGPKHRWRCPVCQQFIDHLDLQNVKLAEQINALRVRCSNSKYGCPFISYIDAMPEHLKGRTMTKEAALPAIYKGTNTMQAVVDEIGKINKKINALNDEMNIIGQLNKKIDMLNEGMNVVSDMIIQLDKVDNQNKNDVEMAVDDLKRRVQGVQSELHATTDRMQNELTTIQDSTNQVPDEMKVLQTEFEIFKIAIVDNNKNSNSDNQKLSLNKKITKAKMQMENAIATEKALRIDDCKQQSAQLNVIGGKLDKVTEHLTKHEECHNAIQEQFKANINDIKAELEKTKNKHEAQLATINHCNELISKLKLNEDEMKNNIKQSQDKINELEKNWKRMEEYMTLEETTNFHKIQEIVSNQKLHQSQTLVYSWTIKSIKENMNKKAFEIESTVFPLSGYHFGAKVRLTIYESGYAYMSLCFVDDKNTNHPIEFKIIPTVTFIIKDQMENRKSIIMTSDMDYKESFEYDKYYYCTLKFSATIMHLPYVMNDTMVIDIYVESPSIAQKIHSTNGQIKYHINNYNMNKALEKRDFYSQYSPYFYTSPTGYRLKVFVYLNGLSYFKEKGLTAFINFLPGEFDSTLSETFKHRITFTIFNQSDPNKHLVKSVQQDKKDYYMDIATHSLLENDGFLLNDTLIYRVEIKEI